MLVGPLIGNFCVWLLMLWMKRSDPEPPARQPSIRVDGPEMIPFGSKKRGSALSDFVKAMREADDEPIQTSTLTPGMPTRINIHSPKTNTLSPLFPLSAPLTNETCMSPGNFHDSTFSLQISGFIDSSILKTPSPTNKSAFGLNALDEEDDSQYQSAQSPPSHAELLNEARSIPLPQSPPHQPTTFSPSEGRRVRFSPHVRTISTGSQLFPADQQRPLLPNVYMPTPPIRPVVWDEEDEDGSKIWG
jgi:hypothetical protein